MSPVIAVLLLILGIGLVIAGAEALLDGLLASAARFGVSAFAITVSNGIHRSRRADSVRSRVSRWTISNLPRRASRGRYSTPGNQTPKREQSPGSVSGCMSSA